MNEPTPDRISQLYDERLRRWVTAMRNGEPDRIPMRPFVAEFAAALPGFFLTL